MNGHDYRTEVTLAAGSRRARVALASSRPVELGEEVLLLDCDLATAAWTVVGVHGVRPVADEYAMWYCRDDRTWLGPETMAWFEIRRRGDLEFDCSLRLRRDASERQARELLASALADAAAAPDEALIGPSRGHRGECLVAWADLGGFTRVWEGWSLAPFDDRGFGFRWMVLAARQLLAETPASRSK